MERKVVKIAPSILFANLARLGEQAAEVERCGATLTKIQRVRQMIDQGRFACELELDGGMDAETARLEIYAGAEVMVAGSSIFGHHEGVEPAMRELQGAIEDMATSRPGSLCA
jgi:pentose-5-phosphate-3-epimerase